MKPKTQKKPIVRRGKLSRKSIAKTTSKTPAKKSIPTLEVASAGYPEVKALDHLNIITEHWLSDICFFEDEIRFLHNLISKYFVWLTEEENIKSTKEIAHELAELEKQRRSIEQRIHQHIHTYRNLFENPFSHDRNEFKLEHLQLERGLTEFVRIFRSVKQKTFSLTELVIQSEKVKHLLTDQQGSN